MAGSIVQSELSMANIDFWNIPIFIISYNRKADLEKLLNRLLQDGYKNLNIVDNHSSDESLVSYLDELERKSNKCIKIHRLSKNWGHKVIWKCHLFDDILENGYYVVTDPDIIPIDECPNDYVKKFYEILQKYPQKTKVGFALKIDDLPESYVYKYDIIRFESFYWEKHLPYDFIIYDAPIDTTFALYKPGKMKEKEEFYSGIRTGDKYQARHLGWYETINKTKYYDDINNLSSTSMSSSAMEDFQIIVIQQLLSRQRFKFRILVRKIFTVKQIVERYSLFDVVLGVMVILAKKILGPYKLR